MDQSLPFPAILNIPTQLGGPVERKAGSSCWGKVEGLCSVGKPKGRHLGAQHHACMSPWGPECVQVLKLISCIHLFIYLFNK